MSENKNNRKKFLLPVAYLFVLGTAIWGGNTLIPTPESYNSSSSSVANLTPLDTSTAMIEPAAGDEAVSPTTDEKDAASPIVDVPSADSVDAPILPPLRISSDKPEIIQLSDDAVNILVGSEETLRAMPDTARSIILIPKKPGATFVKVTNAAGKTIFQRPVIVGTADKENRYLRIRRACATGDTACKQFSLYYCPDMCHEVNVIQGQSATETQPAPTETPSGDMSSPVTE